MASPAVDKIRDTPAHRGGSTGVGFSTARSRKRGRTCLLKSCSPLQNARADLAEVRQNFPTSRIRWRERVNSNSGDFISASVSHQTRQVESRATRVGSARFLPNNPAAVPDRAS